jgi:hypothetical protein
MSKATCEPCKARDFGTDTHYVCHATKSPYFKQRVNKQHKACKLFKGKRKD